MTPIEQYYMMIILPGLQETARECGYALSFHGSAARDLDLVATPWIEEALPAETLVAAMADRIGAKIDGTATKPHGRRVWTMGFLLDPQRGPYVDVSVMPRIGAIDGVNPDPV